MRKMSKEEREKLYKIMKEVVEKHKDNKLLYKKMNKALEIFQHCHPIDQEIYKELANLTTKIDFECYFENGRCRKDRTEMCCCSNCRNYFGHLKTIFFTVYHNKQYIEKEMLYYAKKYSINTGFWRKGKGCILPRYRRSSTCLCYNCSDRLTNEETLVLNILYGCRELPSYIKPIIKMLKNYFLYKVE